MVLEIAPSEFWQMPPRHFWWLMTAKAEEAKRMRAAMKQAGPLTAADKDDLRDMMDRKQAELNRKYRRDHSPA